MNQLILGTNPPVKSISLRKRYAIRGTRLIHLGSLLAHLEAVAESQNKNSIGNNEINIEEIKKAQADLLEAIAANHLLR